MLHIFDGKVNGTGANLLSSTTGRPLGLPRNVLLAAGLLSVAVLLAEHGFNVHAASKYWLHFFEAALAGVYITDRIRLIYPANSNGLARPGRWHIIRQRGFEFAVLVVFGLLFLALAALSIRGSELVRSLLGDHPWNLALGLLKLFLVSNVLVQLLRLQQRLLFRGARPEWILAGSFAMLILAGTLLLLMPRVSAAPEQPITLLNAFFTATSASCVTGLSVRDTGSEFSVLGQGIILALFQAGGLGIMTFVAFLAVTSAESLPVPQMLAFRQLVGARSAAVLKRHVLAIVAFTVLVEGAGAVFIFACLPAEQDTLAKIGWSVFHAVSAFCNAGFSLSADSLMAFQGRPGVMIVFMGLIVLGGLGFLVVVDLLGLQISRMPLIRQIPWVRRYNSRVPVYRLPVQTRLSILVTVILIVAGMAGFWALEVSGVLAGQSLATQFWDSAFQSVTARTAGFNTVPIDQLAPATLLLIMALMVVGASPVSTGGGIKTVTFAVILLALRALIAGRQRVEVFGRALPQRVLLASLAVVLLYVLAAGVGTFALAIFDPALPLKNQMFEVVSALSTVGLSTGITAQLSPGSQLTLCALMFIGRVGPISLLLSVVRMEHPTRYQYPEEDLVVG
jgi:trk system potassium uptake protein